MKKISTVGAKQSRNFREQKLMIDLDLGDRSSWYCVLDEAEEVLLREKVDLGPHERYQLVWRRSEQLSRGRANRRAATSFRVTENGISLRNHSRTNSKTEDA